MQTVKGNPARRILDVNMPMAPICCRMDVHLIMELRCGGRLNMPEGYLNQLLAGHRIIPFVLTKKDGIYFTTIVAYTVV